MENNDYLWLASKVSKSLKFLYNKDQHLYNQFKKYIDEYFNPILEGKLSIDEEDQYFDIVDSLLDELNELYPEIFK
jgi:hypothetical protein